MEVPKCCQLCLLYNLHRTVLSGAVGFSTRRSEICYGYSQLKQGEFTSNKFLIQSAFTSNMPSRRRDSISLVSSITLISNQSKRVSLSPSCCKESISLVSSITLISNQSKRVSLSPSCCKETYPEQGLESRTSFRADRVAKKSKRLLIHRPPQCDGGCGSRDRRALP